MKADHSIVESINEVDPHRTTMHIDIRDMGKTFDTPTGSIEVLNNVNLSIDRGEFVSILGASGCGKTTLLKIIAGIEKPTSGEVIFDSPDSSKKRCAVVFQSNSLFPWRSALDNVSFGPEQTGYSIVDARKIGRKWLKQVGLDQFGNYYPHQLSGGMQQRVNLARAFAYDADIILMDEPFSAVDELTRRNLQKLLIELSEQYQKTVIYVTHSADEAILMSDRIAVLTNKTGGIHSIHSVNVPRPRLQHADLNSSATPDSLKGQLWKEMISQNAETSNLQFESSSHNKNKIGVWQALWVPILVLSIWEFLARFGMVDQLFWPAPTHQSMMLIQQLANGNLIPDTLATMSRMLITLFLSIIIGGGVGFAMGLSPRIRNALYPTVAALYPIPKIVILPFCMLIFGIGPTSLIALGTIAASFLILMNTFAGVMNVPMDIIMAGRIYGANKFQLVSKVILPAALPFIFVGIRLGMGMALAVMVASEFIASDDGLGYTVWTSWQILDMDTMFPAIIIVTFIGVMFHHGMKWIEKKYLPWQKGRN